jgi:hypothetical protein
MIKVRFVFAINEKEHCNSEAYKSSMITFGYVH